MWVPYHQSFHPGWGGPRRSALDRISRHTQDRWAPRQTGQGHLADPVRPPPTGGQTALPRKERFPPKKVYRPKIREEEVQEMDIDPERTTGLDIIQIGTMNVPVKESGKRPVVTSNQVVTPTQKGSVVNDHDASGSKSRPECFLPRWCPPGLTHTQRRKLQRLRLREKREKELEKKRDEDFNSYRPMVPQGKEWRVKAATQPWAVTSPDGAVQPPGAVKPGDQAVRPGSPETPPGFAPSIPMVCDDKVSSVHTPEDDEQLVDYSSSPEQMNLEINVVHLFVDRSVPTEEDLAHLNFGPKDAIFQKPKDTDNYLKALHMKGHINGKPISRMLVDGGVIVNLMPYSLFKKLGGSDEELIKTNMTVSGVGGGEPMGAKGVISMELTIGSKTLATAFFAAETQGNFSLILGRDWIHANKCVPSTLHQMLVQWVDDEVEVVHGDNSACVVVADSQSIGIHDDVKCLSGLDLSDYEFVSCSNNGFIPAVIKPFDNRLNHVM
jgi:hypothetical protein